MLLSDTVVTHLLAARGGEAAADVGGEPGAGRQAGVLLAATGAAHLPCRAARAPAAAPAPRRAEPAGRHTTTAAALLWLAVSIGCGAERCSSAAVAS